MHAYKQELRLVDQVAADAIRGSVGPLDSARLRRAKVAYTARRMAPERVETLITGRVRPRAGEPGRIAIAATATSKGTGGDAYARL